MTYRRISGSCEKGFRYKAETLTKDALLSEMTLNTKTAKNLPSSADIFVFGCHENKASKSGVLQ